ncbi:MAG: hypothetical protein ABSD13_06145 [Candidatus Korobacteraceae bacterium]
MKAIISALAPTAGFVKPSRLTAGVAVKLRHVGFYIEQWGSINYIDIRHLKAVFVNA